MKHVIPGILALLVALALIGCNRSANPITENANSGSIRFVAMPATQSLQKMLYASNTITVERGGNVSIKYEGRDSLTNGRVKLDFKLTFRQHSVTNDFMASVNVDVNYLMSTVDIEFGPHGTDFLRPADLDLKVSGLDLSWLRPNDRLHLFYFHNRHWEQMDGDVSFDISKGQIECSNGLLPHFSAYGFGRLDGE